MYKDGYLPERGGVNAQPALLIQYFEQLKMINAKLDDEDLKNPDERYGNDQSPSNHGGMRTIPR